MLGWESQKSHGSLGSTKFQAGLGYRAKPCLNKNEPTDLTNKTKPRIRLVTDYLIHNIGLQMWTEKGFPIPQAQCENWIFRLDYQQDRKLKKGY